MVFSYMHDYIRVAIDGNCNSLIFAVQESTNSGDHLKIWRPEFVFSWAAKITELKIPSILLYSHTRFQMVKSNIHDWIIDKPYTKLD